MVSCKSTDSNIHLLSYKWVWLNAYIQHLTNKATATLGYDLYNNNRSVVGAPCNSNGHTYLDCNIPTDKYV